ncbi:helix-turn-helix domain-containing protein [Pseudomonas sp. PCH199]|uniref:helix-turn-helix transcriptional regulator n=1 Tax=unclassified Pseudomonas TaxID=196821 RepID=UPI000BD45E98|nr:MULTISPECIES: helix-turn-helix domain-containing protein [unclassified Pseudomonas]MCW8275179.1 helix-turn-helix domain-containing protein [Pseudomonas sp. PCH199]PAM84847.1 transcriptional regulator [Pseudomonas sp. ERMR1:02]
MANRTYSPMTLSALQIFSQLIQIKRKERGLTQQALAERVGVSRSLVQRVESADPRCEIGVVFEMASLLGIQLFQASDSHSTLLASLQDKLALLPAHILVPKQEVSNDF